MPVANAVPLKAVCALEEVADSCGTDLGAKRLSGVWHLRALGQRHARCAWNCETLSSAEHSPQCQECSWQVGGSVRGRTRLQQWPRVCDIDKCRK